MNDVRPFYRKLIGFLNLKNQDKQDVIDWYDSLPNQSSLTDNDMLAIEQRAKLRVMASIQRAPRVVRLKPWLRLTVAAAALLIVGFFTMRYFNQPDIASPQMLASISPAKDRAIIVLDNGQEIDLDLLASNQPIQVGQSIITKNAQGQISYQDASTGKEQVQINSLRVPKAATYQLTLTDGTRVMLNSDSKLTYPSNFGAGDRVVQLTGEAYFEVAKTAHKSKFIVESANQRVQVLGTKFNVKSYSQGEGTQTTLAEGSVLVSAKAGLAKPVLLKPSQQTVLVDNNLFVKRVNLADVLGWMNGQFCFNGSNTVEVLAEIARWYDIDIKYEGKANTVQYEGKIPRNLSLDRLIELLNYAELKTKAFVDDNKRINLLIK